MTTEEIIKNNKLIAEFMDFPKEQDYKDKEPFYNISSIKKNNYMIESHTYFKQADLFTPKEMEFEASWDWLMPVVEKIERLNLDNITEVKDSILGADNKARFWIGNERVYVSITPDWVLANILSTDNRLSNTYYCVIEFIKWYNNNSK